MKISECEVMQESTCQIKIRRPPYESSLPFQEVTLLRIFINMESGMRVVTSIIKQIPKILSGELTFSKTSNTNELPSHINGNPGFVNRLT